MAGSTDEGHVRDALELHNSVMRDILDGFSFQERMGMIPRLDEASKHINAIRVRNDRKRKDEADVTAK